MTSVAWAKTPFGAYTGDVYREVMPIGLTISEILARVPNLPDDFARRGVVMVNDHIIPPENWRLVRPRAKGPIPVSVTLHMSLGRDGAREGGAGKNILVIIAAIALLALTSWIGAGGIGAALGIEAFSAGTFGARVLAAGVGLVGSLLLQALSPPPVNQQDGETNQGTGAGISGNILAKGTIIPSVLGTHRVYPALAAYPRIDLDGDDEVAKALFCLAGPHALTEPEIDGVPIADITDGSVTVNLNVGVSFFMNQSYTAVPGFSELTSHKFDKAQNSGTADGWLLEDQTTPANSLPKWHRVTGRKGDAFASNNYVDLHLVWPQGLALADGSLAAQPMRIRIRRTGEAWVNLPEIIWVGKTTTLTRRRVRLNWSTIGDATPLGPNNTGEDSGGGLAIKPLWLFGQTEAQTSPASGPWTAHTQWFGPSGNDKYFGPTSVGSGGLNTANTRLRFLEMTFYGIEFRAILTNLPLGTYEIEVMRGAIFDPSNFNPATYVYSGAVRDFFHYKNASGFRQIRSGTDQREAVTIVRVVTQWSLNAYQGTSPGLQYVYVSARNRIISRFSVLATRQTTIPTNPTGAPPYTWTATTTAANGYGSNPAAQLRQILLSSNGALNDKPLAVSQLEMTVIDAWFQRCRQQGYTCDMVVSGESIATLLSIIAGCGYARPFKSELWGVAQDYDRSAESPVQIFSPRNMTNFRWQKGFADRPNYVVARYLDSANKYEPTEVVVNDVVTGVVGETVDYKGLVNSLKVSARAEYDLGQARLRSTFYTGEVWTEHIVCRRGDLVGIQHDALARQAGFARIKEVLLSGPNVTGLVLDSVIPLDTGADDFFAIENLYTVSNVFTLSGNTGVAIRLLDGSVLIKEITGDVGESSTITFTTPFADPGSILAPDCLVVSGPLGQEYRRCLVLDITPRDALSARMVFVDEANELWQ